jgi:hypothetical protein
VCGLDRHLLISLAFVAGRAGRHEQAIECAERALALARAVGGPSTRATALTTIAIAYLPVEPDRALTLAEEAAGIRDFGRETPATAMRQLMVATVRAGIGDDTRALEMLVPVLEYCRRTGERFVLPRALESTARSLGRLGRNESAVRLLAATARFRAETDLRSSRGDDESRARAERRLREALRDTEFETQWAAGAALSTDQTIVFAISEATAARRPH